MTPPVFDLLNGDSAVSALVADRIYPAGRAPTSVVKPYVTWQVIGGHAESYLSERPGIDQDLVQIDCWSLDYAQSVTLMKAVVAACELAGTQSGTPMDDYESDTELYRWITQFYFWTRR